MQAINLVEERDKTPMVAKTTVDCVGDLSRAIGFPLKKRAIVEKRRDRVQGSTGTRRERQWRRHAVFADIRLGSLAPRSPAEEMGAARSDIPPRRAPMALFHCVAPCSRLCHVAHNSQDVTF